jgi:hypothetical protein
LQFPHFDLCLGSSLAMRDSCSSISHCHRGSYGYSTALDG